MRHLWSELSQVLLDLLSVNLIRPDGSFGQQRDDSRLHLHEAPLDKESLFGPFRVDQELTNPEAADERGAAGQDSDGTVGQWETQRIHWLVEERGFGGDDHQAKRLVAHTGILRSISPVIAEVA